MPQNPTRPGSAPTPVVPNYSLLRLIGAGSYGQVWLARGATGTFHAVKVVRRGDSAEGRDFARAFRGLRHYEPISRQDDSLMDVLHVGINDGEAYFYCVMELADPAPADGASRPAFEYEANGGDPKWVEPLWEAANPIPVDPDRYVPLTLRWIQGRQPRLPVAECVEIGIALCRALGALHRHDLVHRDIKPSNIIFARGRPKLADIDLVTPPEGSLRRRVTEGYTAPEGAGTVPADIYSLGKVLYEISTGKDRTDFPAPADELSLGEEAMWADLNDVLLRACKPAAADRHQSGRELYDELQLVRTGKPIRRLRLLERRQKTLARASMVVLGLALLGGGAYVRERHLGGQLRKAEAESRGYLVDLQMSNARRAMNDGDWHLAALWFARALATTRSPTLTEQLRWRLGILREITPRIVAMGQHADGISEVAFSPDGRWFATGSEDGTARIWDAESGSAIGVPFVHGQAVNVVKINPDGLQIATAGLGGECCLWNIGTGDLAVPRMAHGNGEVICLAFSPDGRLLATGGRGGIARVWETRSGQEHFQAIQHRESIEWIEFSPDGDSLVTAGRDHQAIVWRVEDGSHRFEPYAHPAEVNYATFSPDGGRLLTACDDGIARFWNMATGESEGLEIRHSRLNYAAFSHDGRWVVTTTGARGEMSEVQVWNSTNGAPLGTPIRHASRIRYAEFSPDDRWLASASHDGIVTVTRVGLGEGGVRLTHGDRIWALAFSRDGRRLVTAGGAPVWRMWDLAQQVSSPFRCKLRAAAQQIVEITSDGLGLIYGSAWGGGAWRLAPDGQLVETLRVSEGFTPLWTDPNGHCILTCRIDPNGLGAEILNWPGLRSESPPLFREQVVTSAASSPDGRQLFVGTLDGQVRLVNPESGTEGELLIQMPNRHVQQLAVSPDGTRLAASCWSDNPWQGSFALLNTSSWEAVIEPVLGTVAISCVAFGRDGALLAVGEAAVAQRDCLSYLYDPHDGSLIHKFPPAQAAISCFSFSPDGHFLATGDSTGLVSIWSLKDFSLVRGPLYTQRGVRMLDFSPDGRILTGSSANGEVWLWDVDSAEPLVPPLRHGGSAWVSKFADRGRRLLTSAEDGEVRIWNLNAATEPAALLQRDAELNACTELAPNGTVRTLPPEEVVSRWESIQASRQR